MQLKLKVCKETSDRVSFLGFGVPYSVVSSLSTIGFGVLLAFSAHYLLEFFAG